MHGTSVLSDDCCGHTFVHRKKPNLIVHLDVSPEESKRRIEMRQRECESTISVEYLQNLHLAYEEFLKDISWIIPVIRVNYKCFRSADEMAEMIIRWVMYSFFCKYMYSLQALFSVHHLTCIPPKPKNILPPTWNVKLHCACVCVCVSRKYSEMVFIVLTIVV